jgi:hypothetical protein
MVVGPIIAHVSVNNNLPFENNGNPHEISLLSARGGVGGFLAKYCPVADHPQGSMLDQQVSWALSPLTAFYVRRATSSDHSRSRSQILHDRFDKPSLSSFVPSWQTPICIPAKEINKHVLGYISQ